jgi:hypothetical protein
MSSYVDEERDTPRQMKDTSIIRVLTAKAKNNFKVASFDVETTQIERQGYTEQVFQMASWGYYDSKNELRFRTFFDRTEAQDFALSDEMSTRIQYATHLDFDFLQIFGKSKHLKDMYKLSKNGSIIYARKNVDKHNVWTFNDTMNYERMSVERLGKVVGLPKLPSPKCFLRDPETFEEKQELIAYNRRDVEITLRYALLLKQFFTEQNAKMKITVSSTGFDYLRRNALKTHIIQEPLWMLEKHYNGAIRGGRTEVIQRGHFNNVVIYDYKSHYPASCADGIDGKGSFGNPSTAQHIKNVREFHYLEYQGITNCTIKAPYMKIPYIGYKDETKLLFPWGTFTGWFNNYELQKAVEVGYEVTEPKEAIVYHENFIPFREKILDLYQQKLKYEKEGNEGMRAMVKTLMNGGFFGKTIQRLTGHEELYSEEEVECDPQGNFYVHKKNGKMELLESAIPRGEFVFNKNTSITKAPKCALPILGGTVTAIARYKLWNNMQKYPDELLYVDTDSFFMTKDRFETGEELGNLELQKRCEEVVIVRPKLYLYKGDDGKVVAKGKGLGRMDETSFNTLLRDKRASLDIWTKIKSSAQQQMPLHSIVHMTKEISLEDDKRLWQRPFNPLESQDSEPIKL